MDSFTQTDIAQLAADRSSVCISLYMRAHRTAPENQQDPIRFRNMLSGAEKDLTGLGMRQPAAHAMLEPARSLGAEKTFWQHQNEGLAVFVTENFFRSYRLPIPFDDLLVVTGRFHLRPLLPFLAEEIQYYLLALSRSSVRLFEGSRAGLGEVALPGVPQGMDEALMGDQIEAYEQYHVRSGGAGRETALFYGRGEGRDNDTDRVSRYFHRVNDRIQDFLKDRNAPLVIAGVEYLLPLYREANTFPAILPEGITGNVEAMSADELHQKALPLLDPLITKGRREAQEEFHRLLGTGKASTFTPEIVPASYQGRVSALLVSARRHEWGTVDRINAGIIGRFCSREEQGCEDLYDFAAVQTLLKGGKVYVMDGESAADSAAIAAVFRY